MQKIIKIVKPNRRLQETLVRELGISLILAQILINRGMHSVGLAEKFLNPRLQDLISPWQMKDMDLAVKRVVKAAKLKKKVLIFGDYDVDGITSSALLRSHLQRLGLSVLHYIPHRVKEGYGLNLSAGEAAKKQGIDLIITVDCGITSFSVIEQFRGWGIDVIVTDHHQPQDELPAACAVINPKRRDCSYGYKNLSGVGVAFKFAQALTNDSLLDDLDLVALGTIADSVALNGENRIIAKEGLKKLFSSPRAGIQALMEISGIDKKKNLGAQAVSFILGPRLNAGGRIDTAEDALRLLLSQSSEEARDISKILESHNRKRQKIEGKILSEAKDIIDKEVSFKEDYVIVVSGQNWHEGVLGIVASRLMDTFYRPVVLISEGVDNYCRGSARSIKDFSIFDALSYCQTHLKEFGGHKLAAGLTIDKENINDFRQDINQFARNAMLNGILNPSIEVDMEIALGDLNEDLIYMLESLEPFGTANPRPIFYTRNLRLRSQPQILSRDTVKFWVTDANITYPVIGFGLGRKFKQKLSNADCFDLIYHPDIDTWQGKQDIILEAKEIIIK